MSIDGQGATRDKGRLAPSSLEDQLQPRLTPVSTLPTQAALAQQIDDILQGIDGPPSLRGVVGCAVTPDGTNASQSVIAPFEFAPGSSSGLTTSSTTPFLLASVTKTFTATLYAMHFLGLNQTSQDLRKTPVIDRFNDCPNLEVHWPPPLHGPQRTFDQLVTHTSGLPSYNKPASLTSIPNPNFPDKEWEIYPRENLASDLPHVHPAFPGHYSYSDLGFAMLGLLMEEERSRIPLLFPPAIATAIGSTYEEMLRSTIFGPLDMPHSFLIDPAAKNGIPQGWYMDGKWKMKNVHEEYFPAFCSSGGIVTNGNDMMNWLTFNMGTLQGNPMPWSQELGKDLYLGVTLPATQDPRFLQPGNNSICRGWFVTPAEQSPVGIPLVCKDGSLPGTNTYIAFTARQAPESSPDSQAVSSAGVFVLMNASGVTMDDGAGHEVSLPKYMSETLISYMIKGWPSSP